MFKSKIKNQYRKSKNSRFYQGDILKNLDFIIGHPDKQKDKDRIHLEYAVILSQDCDLQSDFEYQQKKNNHDKFLEVILVSPAYQFDKFVVGRHILDWSMRLFNNKEIPKLKNNNELKRYHYLPSEERLLMPELILDFKHFFTIPRHLLYNQRRIIYLASLNELFREELSQRFFNYLSRIGLPEFK